MWRCVGLSLLFLRWALVLVVWLCALCLCSFFFLRAGSGFSVVGLVPVFRLRAFAAGWGVRAAAGWGWGFGPVLAVAGRAGG